MIFAVFREKDRTTTGYLFYGWDRVHQATFNPDCELVYVTDFAIVGKNYKEAKEFARNLAIDIWEHLDCSLSWSEWATIQYKLENIARKYGLCGEFRENGLIGVV